MATEPLTTEARVLPPERLSDFWRGIYPDGMTIEQVCNELHDLEFLAENVPKVYDHVTGGKVTKANTDPSVVQSLHDDHVTELVNQALAEEQEDRP